MNIVLSLLLLNYFFVIQTFQCNDSCFCQQYKFQRSTMRGNYKNILQEQNGALLSNRFEISFVGPQFNRSPLRSEVYFIEAQGYTAQYKGIYMIIDLLQTYEINTIQFWLYDRDSYLRTYDLKVYIQGIGSRELIYQNIVATSIVKIKFNNSFVKQILILNNNGSSINNHSHILNIQAYFQL